MPLDDDASKAGKFIPPENEPPRCEPPESEHMEKMIREYARDHPGMSPEFIRKGLYQRNCKVSLAVVNYVLKKNSPL